MKSFRIEKSQGDVGFEKTTEVEICEAENAEQALRMSTIDTKDWPYYPIGADCGLIENPEYVDTRYEDCYYATEICQLHEDEEAHLC